MRRGCPEGAAESMRGVDDTPLRQSAWEGQPLLTSQSRATRDCFVFSTRLEGYALQQARVKKSPSCFFQKTSLRKIPSGNHLFIKKYVQRLRIFLVLR